MKKKQADIYNALTSVKQQALEIDRTALKEYKLHIDELRDRECQIEIKNKKHSEQMRLKRKGVINFNHFQEKSTAIKKHSFCCKKKKIVKKVF